MAVKRIPIAWLLGAFFATTFAILTFIWTPYELVLKERLRMRPGLPGFDWWYEPPDVRRLKIRLFNITNAERYLSGQDGKLKMEEIGPIIFKEVLIHSDVVFNDNSTMSYTVKRKAILDPNLNTIDFNATIIFPNLPILLTASLFWDANYFVKQILNYAFDMTKSQVIVKKTIYEILYNNTDPFLDIAHATMPSIAVHKNVGLIPLICPEYENRMNVFMGTKYGHQNFFLIEKFNGTVHLPRRGPSCKDTIVNSSSSIMYCQLVPKARDINYFEDLMCRSAPLTYDGEVYREGIKAYKFVGVKSAFDRIQPIEDDCYKSSPILPDGLTDLAPCWFNFPVVGSYPHFLYGDPILNTYVDGLNPNASQHRAYAVIEPTTGIILDSRAGMQVSVHVKPLKYFHEMFDKFSNTIIPAFVLESTHDHVPKYLITLIRVILLLPTVGTILSTIMLIFGLYCTWNLQKGLFKKRNGDYADVELHKEGNNLEQVLLDDQQRLSSNDNSKQNVKFICNN